MERRWWILGSYFLGIKGLYWISSGLQEPYLGDHIGSPLQSCGFAEFDGHIGFFPGKVGEVSAKMSAV